MNLMARKCCKETNHICLGNNNLNMIIAMRMKNMIVFLIYMVLQLCFLGCVEMKTSTVIYKPNCYRHGYSLNMYTPYNCFVVCDDEHGYYGYVFCLEAITGKFFISNDSSLGYEVRLNKRDTVVKCGRDTTLKYHWSQLTTKKQGRYWKTIYVLNPERRTYDGFEKVYGNSIITYGYVNVRLKDKRIYDKIINSVRLLEDTTITKDSIAIKYNLTK